MRDETARGATWPREALAVALVLLAAAGIRLISLPNEAVWYDEIATLEFLDAPSLVEFLKQAHAVTPSPPLYAITQYAWARAFGDSVLSLRLLSLVYGLAGLAALYGLGRALLGHRAALVATAWMSLMFWHIYHSQEIRFYGMVTLLALLCVWTFLRFVTRPAPATLAIHALISGLMIWTHPHSALLFCTLGLFLLCFHWRSPKLVAAWLAPHLLLAGSLVAFMASIDRELAYAQTGWFSLPTLWRGYPSVRGFLAMSAGLMEFPPINRYGQLAINSRALLWIVIELTTLAALAITATLHLSRGKLASPFPGLTQRELGALLLLWFIVPPVVAFAASYAWRPVFLGRYLAFATPPLYLALGYLMTRRARRIDLAAFVPLIVFVALYYFPGPLRTPYDRVVETIQAHPSEYAEIFVDDMIATSSIDYYWNGEPPVVRSPIDMEKAVNPFEETVHFDGPSNWLLLTDEKRARYMRTDLRRANAEFTIHYFPSLRPAWLFHVPGPFHAAPPQNSQ